MPILPGNVDLHIGYFDGGLPEFLQSHSKSIAFLHVDCGLYSSTVTIFELLGNRQQHGTIILFDEYYYFHRWQQHEFKAFQEFIAKSDLTYEIIAYSVTGQQVAVRISA